MQYKLLAISALVASALAAPEKRQATSSSLDAADVLSVLETALPSSLVALAETNSAAAASIISSEFANGAEPSWYSALPSNIQTYLVPVNTTTAYASGTGVGTVSGLPSHSANSTNSTTIKTTSSRLTSLTSSSSSAPATTTATTTTAAKTSKSTGAASMPTAIMGMSLAGVVGLVGVLAL